MCTMPGRDLSKAGQQAVSTIGILMDFISILDAQIFIVIETTVVLAEMI